MWEDPLLFAAIAVPPIATPILVLTAWWIRLRKDTAATSKWRADLLHIGLLASSANVLIFYVWLAYRLVAGSSPMVWQVRSLLGSSLALPTTVVVLLGGITGQGTARIPLAVSALTGFLLWIGVGIL
jgi:hypothetical protein